MRGWHWALAAVLLALLLALPDLVNAYVVGILTTAFYFAVYAMSWDLLFGYSNVVNFGPTFLIGLGAYGAGLLNALAGLPIWLCVIAGTALAVVGGLALAAPALRLRGVYFGIITFIAVLVLQRVIVIFAGVTGGEIGLAVPSILSVSTRTNYDIALWFMAISAAIMYWITRSSLGLIFQAIGQDRVAAEAMGFNAVKYKLLAFGMSAFFSGMAGAFTAFYLGTASVGTVVAVAVAIQVIIAAVVGGRRTIVGSIIGAVFLIAAGEALRPLGDLNQLIVAAIALGVLLLFPGGILGLLQAVAARR